MHTLGFASRTEMEVVKGDLMANTQTILDEEVPVQPRDFGKKKRKCRRRFACNGVWLTQLVAFSSALRLQSAEKWLHDPKELLYGSVVFRGKVGVVSYA